MLIGLMNFLIFVNLISWYTVCLKKGWISLQNGHIIWERAGNEKAMGSGIF